jgi:hypothetical protein
MHEIEKLPQFDIQILLEMALRKLDAANAGDIHNSFVENARIEVATVLAAQPKTGEGRGNGAESTLRRTAMTLTSVSDLNVESARLAILSAADMLRSE